MADTRTLLSRSDTRTLLSRSGTQALLSRLDTRTLLSRSGTRGGEPVSGEGRGGLWTRPLRHLPADLPVYLRGGFLPTLRGGPAPRGPQGQLRWDGFVQGLSTFVPLFIVLPFVQDLSTFVPLFFVLPFVQGLCFYSFLLFVISSPTSG